MSGAFDLFSISSDHEQLRNTVRAFVRKEVEPQALEHDKKERFNLALFRKAGELGLLGITAETEYDGAGLDAAAAVIVHEELSWSDPGFCLAYLAHAMLCVNNISVNADAPLKKRVLPKLVSGEWVGAMAMSEPHVGTDVLGMQTTATLSGSHYALTGRKMWITNGTIDENRTPADCVLVYAKTGEEKGRAKVTTFVIEKGFKGYSVGQKINDKCGMRASNTAELVFDHCEVPLSHRIGEEGESMRHMMRNLEIERLTLAAMSVGLAKRSLEVMIRYADERKAFGKSLHAFGQIQRHIAESYAEYRAARCYLYETARRLDLNKGGHRVDSDGVKLFAAEVGKKVADRAMQVLGGYGYVGEYVVERLWRDAKLLEIGGGTLEAHQKNITRDLDPAATL